MSKPDPKKEQFKIVATNHRAFSQYEIIDTLEAGMILTGAEVKSLRNGKANLQDGFARLDGEVAVLMNVHIAPYAMGSTHIVQEPTRTRKLLMNHHEIIKWMGKAAAKGYTIVPLEIYFNKRQKAKVKLALARGKNAPDRREDLKKRTLGRELQREFAGKYKLR